jgi:hypothetical protein
MMFVELLNKIFAMLLVTPVACALFCAFLLLI